jgi:hypothetical protein
VAFVMVVAAREAPAVVVVGMFVMHSLSEWISI